MALNWVMLKSSGELEPLPHESILYKTRGRLAIQISAPSADLGVPPFLLKCEKGTGYLTTQRIIYLPNTPTESFKSFSSKILSAQDGHMDSPWIGASFWEATVKPVPNGNIPAEYPRLTIKLTFYDGGHSEWTLKFENIKGRLAHAAQIARETGQTNILNSVHDEQLPEYSARQGETEDAHAATSSQAQVEERAEEATEERRRNQPVPDEPPPDYDEAQAQAVAMRFDERTQEDAERR